LWLCVQLWSDNALELASLYLLIVNFLTGLLISVTHTGGVTGWVALLLVANGAFMLAALVLGLAPRLAACCRKRGSLNSSSGSGGGRGAGGGRAQDDGPSTPLFSSSRLGRARFEDE
jgi:hypothetical protein